MLIAPPLTGNPYGDDVSREAILVPDISMCLNAGSMGRIDAESETLLVAHALRADGFDASEDGTGRGTPIVVAFDTTQITHPENRCNPQPGDACHPLSAHAPAIAFDARQSDVIQYGDISGPLDTDGHSVAVQTTVGVRRLTPRECERLQGAPDDWTLVLRGKKPMKDGPRYKILGNSFAVPCIRWIGERIDAAEAHARRAEAA